MNNNRLSKCGNSSKDYECDRPFKKARYMWQLKGKYYLKNEYQRCNKGGVQLSSKEHRSSENQSTRDSDKGNHSKLKKSNSSNSCQVSECIEEIPLSMVRSNSDNEEYLHKWQTKRIAQSFIDNTINMILENWKISPFDASDLVENCANDGQIEDEGILMAIQSHGLQSTTRINNDNLTKCQANCSSTGTDSLLLQSTMDNYKNTQNETMQENDLIDKENDFKTDDSFDFLRTAVSVAIEKKGLSYTY